MVQMFINELVGAILQLILFSLIPLIFWLIFARNKQNFFEWIGIKKIRHEDRWPVTLCAAAVATLI